ncbi:MAG: CBS domain-containing protein [Euryarchaeota archaeon]|nr:CBS domain-containing protein [Euryarchaeota archaeon]
MDTRLPVAETMDDDPLAMDPKTSVRDAASAMQARGVGGLLVFDGGRMTGILTERDILTKVVAAGRDTTQTTVGDIMTPDPITIPADHDILEALRVMRAHGIRHLPVVGGGRLRGMVTERAISRQAPELLQIAGDWNTITNGHDGSSSSVRPLALVGGVCETCGNEADDLVDVGDLMVCEECAETVRETTEDEVQSPVLG